MKNIFTLTFLFLGATLFAQNAELTGVYYQKEGINYAETDVIHLSKTKISLDDNSETSTTTTTPCYIQWEFTQKKINMVSWCGEYGTGDGWGGEDDWKYTGIGTLQISLSYIKPTRTVAKKYNYSVQYAANGIALTRIK